MSFSIYRDSLSLLTDLYQLTMAYGYWKAGRREDETVFHLFFRRHPFGGGFTVAAGLEQALQYLEEFTFESSDIEYLSTLEGNDGAPLFDAGFLDDLAGFRFECEVDAIPEGTVVFPHEPLVRIRGPIIACQLAETPLLNLINFPTLIATKAARICMSAGDSPVLEFGLRRAQGIDGGLTASRAAYIGGCAGTSNVLAGKVFGIPVRGTHAHSWVMLFDSEVEAFRAYSRALPNNCVFLVDTYDSIEGVRNACKVAAELREQGHEMVGIRLDSGDLAYLSQQARKILDEAGFGAAKILASNDLDEYVIHSLRDQEACIDAWGVGTRLATAKEDPALGGVYKLGAIRRPDGEWEPRLKISEQIAKITNPGCLQVRRFFGSNGQCLADMIFDEFNPPGGGEAAPEEARLIDPMDTTRRKRITPGTPHEDLLVPALRNGKRVAETPPLNEIRERTRDQIARFHGGVLRFVNPHRYPVGLEKGLLDRKVALIESLRAD